MSRATERLSRLERELADAAPAIPYLQPSGLVAGAAAAALVAEGRALPVAGTALAMTDCEVRLRGADENRQLHLPAVELAAWANRNGGPVAERIAILLDRIGSE
ncbi:MAG: hypothetical protein ACREE7_15010, partial [Dongiaceae bacterium]